MVEINFQLFLGKLEIIVSQYIKSVWNFPYTGNLVLLHCSHVDEEVGLCLGNILNQNEMLESLIQKGKKLRLREAWRNEADCILSCHSQPLQGMSRVSRMVSGSAHPSYYFPLLFYFSIYS